MISSALLKYARALVDVAIELQQEDQVEGELLAFSELLNSHQELMETLTNPAIPLSAKRKIVQELAKSVPVTQIVVNFILVLMQHARTHQFQQAAEAYQSVLDERRGILRGDVFSCLEVKKGVQERLQKAASNLTGKDVKINYHLDDSLIGGLKLQIGSTIYDGSIHAQLEEIRRRLTSQ